MDAVDVARICQRAENDYVGVQCGLMDQFAVAAGRAGAATLLDCRTLEHRPVPLPSDLALVVCHTGSARRLGASDYNLRRAECDRAVAALARERPGLTALRDVGPDDLGWAAAILDGVAFRRCRHVVTENARVLETIAALEAADETALGAIFAASHASLRDDYEVSSPELDVLVDVATTTPGVIASRMTGGGFGGCTVVIARPGTEDRLAAEVARRYDAATGLRARVIPVRAVDGAGYVSPSATLPAG
jgi:galactokinase